MSREKLKEEILSMKRTVLEDIKKETDVSKLEWRLKVMISEKKDSDEMIKRILWTLNGVIQVIYEIEKRIEVLKHGTK